MQYIIDTSILIEISKNYYPEVFPSFWEYINELIEDETIVSLVEVQKEIDKGKFSKQWDLINVNSGKNFFKELEGDEMLCLSEITELDIYTEKFKNKKNQVTTLEEEWGTYGEEVADPLLICYGLYHNSTVVTLENPNYGHNIPHVCYLLDVRCIGLKEFLMETEFKF